MQFGGLLHLDIGLSRGYLTRLQSSTVFGLRNGTKPPWSVILRPRQNRTGKWSSESRNFFKRAEQSVFNSTRKNEAATGEHSSPRTKRRARRQRQNTPTARTTLHQHHPHPLDGRGAKSQ